MAPPKPPVIWCSSTVTQILVFLTDSNTVSLSSGFMVGDAISSAFILYFSLTLNVKQDECKEGNKWVNEWQWGRMKTNQVKC